MAKSTPKTRTEYVCQQCGARTPRFGGRCAECGAWNSLVETAIVETRAEPRVRHGETPGGAPVPLSQVRASEIPRLATGMAEADRVLGGGIVPGSLILVGGEPGIGKSTLMIELAALVGTLDQPALYVSAEESPQQVKLRADRLGITADSVHLLAETDVDAIIETARAMRPRLVVIDSIQTIATEAVTSAPGSISQVRECTMSLMRLAKATHLPIVLIGHVTKDGTVAGPRALEHIVDAVLYLEGERFHSYRLLRSVKNRFGATEVGIFEMRGEGMVEVADPSAIFLADRTHRATGSAVTISLEGTRPLVVEVQALVTATSYGTPSRTTTGVDHTRLLMLLAVLTKRAGLRLGQHDVYVNVVGGLDLGEPAADLGVAVAVASSLKERRVGADLALIGEVGLGGELRAVSRVETRVREAARLGFRRVIVPRASKTHASSVSGIQIVAATSLPEAIDLALDAADEGRYDS